MSDPHLTLQDIHDICQRANRKADLAQLADVKLSAGGRGPCPFCGDGRPKDDAFSVTRRRGLWRCFRGNTAECARGGDAVALEMALRGGTALEAARRILGEEAGVPETPERKAQRKRDAEARQAAAERSAMRSAEYHAGVIADLDGNSEPAFNTEYARNWLRARGLPVLRGWVDHPGNELLGDALILLSGVERALHHEDFDGRGRPVRAHRRPAMVAAIEHPEDPAHYGRHVTYLSADGREKTDLEPARKVWGSNRGGVWLTAKERGLGPLFVGEGIETTLSALAVYRQANGPRRGRALAVLSLDNLQGAIAQDYGGCINPAAARAEPSRPAITWPDAGDVEILVDHDMSPLRRKVRDASGRPVERELDATVRMQMCAKLSAHWWRLAGATSVKVRTPPKGMDFNDLVRTRGLGAAGGK